MEEKSGPRRTWRVSVEAPARALVLADTSPWVTDDAGAWSGVSVRLSCYLGDASGVQLGQPPRPDRESDRRSVHWSSNLEKRLLGQVYPDRPCTSSRSWNQSRTQLARNYSSKRPCSDKDSAACQLQTLHVSNLRKFPFMDADLWPGDLPEARELQLVAAHPSARLAVRVELL